jgi:hypothetical protein
MLWHSCLPDRCSKLLCIPSLPWSHHISHCCVAPGTHQSVLRCCPASPRCSGCTYQGTRSQLRGPGNDVNCLQYCLTTKLGFAPSNIVVLRDDDVSKGRDFMPYRCAAIAVFIACNYWCTWATGGMCCDGRCTYVGLLLAAVCTGTSAMAEAARMCNSNIVVLRHDDVSKGRDFMPYRCALLACLLT